MIPFILRLTTLSLLLMVVSAFTETSEEWLNKQSFALEILKIIHSEQGNESSRIRISNESNANNNKTNRQVVSNPNGLKAIIQDIDDALNMTGNYKRFMEWLKSFSFTTRLDLSNRHLVSRLGAINCPSLFRSSDESDLMPKYYLFHENQPEEPFELSKELRSNDCPNFFDPKRKTMLLIHGFASDIRTIGGMINIKDRLLDMNRQMINKFISNDTQVGGLYNIIFVDWYRGANPNPRFNYIRAAANTQVVGKLVARFLLKLSRECRQPINQIDLLAHSLGCHVAGAIGKALRASGHELSSITHLDPVGLCFGPLFGKPEFRLSKDDATETRAIHVAVNLFDNPMDGAKVNFLVNGGRDQIGCGGQSELVNSTISSTALIYDSNASFKPCSHMRAMSLLEDDHMSSLDTCQIVGYECENFERFLSGSCGKCDRRNSQCRLMGFNVMNGQRMRSNVNSLTPIDSEYDEEDDDLDYESVQHRQKDGRIFYAGTSSISPYCVNYYQFRMLVRQRDLKALGTENLAPNRMVQGNAPSGRNTLHYTIKLIDSQGRFFKGFTLDHDSRRVGNLRTTLGSTGPDSGRLVEFTMLLNTTDPRPIRVHEAVISFYYHSVVVAESIEINYMSNISPE